MNWSIIAISILLSKSPMCTGISVNGSDKETLALGSQQRIENLTASVCVQPDSNPVDQNQNQTEFETIMAQAWMKSENKHLETINQRF